MTAGLIAQSKVWCGKTTSAGKNNVRGFYENLALKNSLTERLKILAMTHLAKRRFHLKI